MPRRLKGFPEERKLEVLIQALAAEDIRDILTAGLHRRHILSISNWGLNGGIITPDQFSSILGKIEKPREFPTDPEQRLEALLSVGNTEPKQVLSLLLADNPQSAEALRSQFIRVIEGVQYKGRQWKPGANAIEEYLVGSLDKIGFVVFPVIGANNIWYARTQAGRIYGQPIIAFMLYLSNQLGKSMYQILGTTNTQGDSRAPYNRFKILEFLLNQHKNARATRAMDLKSLLNLAGAGVLEHLKALEKIGFVEWDSVNSELEGQIIYKWVKDKDPTKAPYSTQKNLTREVAEYLRSVGECNNLVIVEHLRAKDNYKKWKYKSLLKDVNSILGHLRKHDFAESDYIGGEIHSHINLVRSWADFVEEFTRKLRNAANGGIELRAMQQLYDSYMADYNRFQHDSRTAVGFYVDVSPNLNKPPADEAQRRILNYLLIKGESRPRDMKKDLKGFNVTNYLSDMITDGRVTKRQEGKKVFYSINPNYRSS